MPESSTQYQLIQQRTYKAIKNIGNVHLENYSILTGLNGSGKSQFIEAIQFGHIAVPTVITNIQAQVLKHEQSTLKLTAYAIDNQYILNKVAELRNLFIYSLNPSRQQYQSDFNLAYQNLETVISHYLGNVYQPQQLHLDYSLDSNSIFEKIKLDAIDLIRNKGPKELKLYDFDVLQANSNKLITHLPPSAIAKHISPRIPYEFVNLTPTNLSVVLYSYYKKVKNFKTDFQARHGNKPSEEAIIFNCGENPSDVINRTVKKLGLDLICDIGDLESEDYEYLSYTFKFKNHHGEVIELESLSSGEKLLIGLSSTKFSPDFTSRNGELKLLLLDEIDASLHPKMLRQMHEIINDEFINKGIKVILVTHSPTTILTCPDNTGIYTVDKNSSEFISKTTKEEAISELSEGLISYSGAIMMLDDIGSYELIVISEGSNNEYFQVCFGEEYKERVMFIELSQKRIGYTELRKLFDLLHSLENSTIGNINIQRKKKYLVVLDQDVKYKLPWENAHNTAKTFYYFLEKHQSAYNFSGIENSLKDSFIQEFITHEGIASSTFRDRLYSAEGKYGLRRFFHDKNVPDNINLQDLKIEIDRILNL
jgi:AAA15 family ATPase/GTPase